MGLSVDLLHHGAETAPTWPSVSSPPLRLSIVIANYNYGRFVHRAIESALAQDWENVEVIVVDDGSTDNSRTVIERFAGEVDTVFQSNAGQRVANNVGFARSTGDIVVFLDADDILLPAFARSVARHWRPGVSKIQVLMSRVDATGRPLGSTVPPIWQAPPPARIREWTTRTGEYPTPPGSGNAYSRLFLKQFFPIGEDHDASTDSTCLALAPFLGDVVTIAKPLACYRLHGANDSNLFADKGRFGREIARAIRRQESAERLCASLGATAPNPNSIRLGWHLLQLRVGSLRSDRGAHPMPDDNRLTVLVDFVRSLAAGGFEPLPKRVLALAWAVATLFAPAPLASRLIRRRFATG